MLQKQFSDTINFNKKKRKKRKGRKTERKKKKKKSYDFVPTEKLSLILNDNAATLGEASIKTTKYNTLEEEFVEFLCKPNTKRL